jgi:hypothetical protein
MAVWISVMEAATRLRVAHMTVRNLVARGRVRGKKLPPFMYLVVRATDVARVARERRRTRPDA